MAPVCTRAAFLLLALALTASACGNEHALIALDANGAGDDGVPIDPPWPQHHTGDDDDDVDDSDPRDGTRGDPDDGDPDDSGDPDDGRRGGDPDDGIPGCTRTQGFWKNHEEAWPVAALDIGGIVYDAAELDALLETPTGGDASLILGHQLIAALLNVAAGADTPPEVDTALDSSQQWMAVNADADGVLPYGTVSRGDAHSQASALADVLADFNEGGLGPGHCR